MHLIFFFPFHHSHSPIMISLLCLQPQPATLASITWTPIVSLLSTYLPRLLLRLHVTPAPTFSHVKLTYIETASSWTLHSSPYVSYFLHNWTCILYPSRFTQNQTPLARHTPQAKPRLNFFPPETELLFPSSLSLSLSQIKRGINTLTFSLHSLNRDPLSSSLKSNQPKKVQGGKTPSAFILFCPILPQNLCKR